jgi:predicted peptidase
MHRSRRKKIVPLALIAAAATVGACAQAQSPVSRFQTETFTAAPGRGVKMPYLLYLPDGYGRSKNWPFILFLHGSGERGKDLNLVTTHGLPKRIKQGHKFPFVIASPQCASGEVWDPDALIQLVDHLQKKYRIDARRTYVTGLSMGGYGTWSLIERYPQRFAAAAPVCGGADRLRTILLVLEHKESLKGLGIWAFHGAKDSVVDAEESEWAIRKCKAAGATTKLTLYPAADHDSWTETYNNPKLIEWFLDFSR